MRKMWKKALAAALSLAMVASSFTGFAAEVQAAETGTVTAEVKDNSVVIDSTQCNGCGLCVNVCPFSAIEKED